MVIEKVSLISLAVIQLYSDDILVKVKGVFVT